MLGFLLSQVQTHCCEKHCTMSESQHLLSFPQTTLHHEGNLTNPSFPSIMKEITITSGFPKSIQHMHTVIREKAQLHWQEMHYNVKESQHLLASASFPFGRSTSSLPKIALHYERNVTHDNFPPIIKEGTKTSPLSIHCQGNLTDTKFPSIVQESTSALPKTTKFHHEGNLTCAIFPYSIKTSAMGKTTLRR